MTPGAERRLARFMAFHKANPHVYSTCVAVARRWRERNHDAPMGFPMVWEVARYTLGTTTTGEPFTLNNNHRALYARYIMRREPDLAGAFEIRQMPGGEPWNDEPRPPANPYPNPDGHEDGA